MEIAFGLGSNLGERLRNLREAAGRLETMLGAASVRSDVFETEPWGGVMQPFYLNACVCFETETDMQPLELLRAVKEMERIMGREESVRWGPRKIDIDILLTGNTTFHAPALQIPHASMHLREFVLTPLEMILPEWKHPVTGLDITEMKKLLPDSSISRIVRL